MEVEKIVDELIDSLCRNIMLPANIPYQVDMNVTKLRLNLIEYITKRYTLR